MNYLITGAGGFIASRLAQRLVETGAHVTAFVRYNSRADIGLLRRLPPEILSQIDIIFGSLTDPDAIDRAVCSILESKTPTPTQPDPQPTDPSGKSHELRAMSHELEAGGASLVFHLGALISIPYSYLHPLETVESNVTGTLNVLQACRKYGVPLVHTSTSEVYGTAQYVPIDEKHPLQGQSPYSASKIAADKLVEAWYRSYDVPSVTIRPFNTYGPGQSARAVIPTIITQALTQDHITLGSTDTLRDFTFLDDTVQGFLLAAQRLLAETHPDGGAIHERPPSPGHTGTPLPNPSPNESATDTSRGDEGSKEGSFPYQLRAMSHELPANSILGRTYNLGTGREITIGHVAQRILTLLNRPDLPIRTDPDRIRPQKSEVMRLLADHSAATRDLGYQPATSLDDGLRLTIDWIKQHLDLYRPGVYER